MKARQALRRLNLIPEAMRLVWDAAGAWTLGWLLLLVLQGAIPAASVFATKWLVDALVTAGGSGLEWESVRLVLMPAAVMGGLLLLAELLKQAETWIRTAQAELVQDHVAGLIHGKAVDVDLAFYEASGNYDLLDKARREGSTRALAMLQGLGGAIQGGLTLLAMAAILTPYGLWLPALLILSTLPVLYVVSAHSRREHAWMERSTPARRWTAYYDLIVTSPTAAPELRLYDQGSRFAGAFQRVRERLRADRLSLLRAQTVSRLVAVLCGLAATAGVMGWMVARYLQGFASAGDLALFYRVFSEGQTVMRTLLTSSGQVLASAAFIEHLFRFLAFAPSVTSPEAPRLLPSAPPYDIDFEGVSFRYPGSDHDALENVTLRIPAGKTVAVVGPNGAGKSTFIKLLCRLYDAREGTVRLGGVDVRQMDLAYLRRQITVMFQQPVYYQATAAENIAMSDTLSAAEMQAVEQAARAAGVHETIAALPNGYETQLGKWFPEGTDLSGGQWQRIALARAFYFEAPVLVLDEPTSAMDSWAEIEWYERFAALARGRTAIFITHRFTTAMRADVIHVMEGGRIAESGSHEELLALGGRYAESWYQQVRQRAGGASPEGSSGEPERAREAFAV